MSYLVATVGGCVFNDGILLEAGAKGVWMESSEGARGWVSRHSWAAVVGVGCERRRVASEKEIESGTQGTRRILVI